jgi:hypothetical protein
MSMPSLSLSDIASALKMPCATADDIKSILYKLDILSTNDTTISTAQALAASQNASASARDAATLRQEVASESCGVKTAVTDAHRTLSDQVDRFNIESGKSFYDTRGDIQDAKFQVHDNIAKASVETAKGFYGTRGDIQDAKFQLHDNVVKSELNSQKGFYDTRGDIGNVKSYLSESLARHDSKVASDFGVTNKYVSDAAYSVNKNVSDSACMTNINLERNSRDVERGISATNINIDKTAYQLSKEALNSERHIEREIRHSYERQQEHSNLKFDWLVAGNNARFDLLAAQAAQNAKEAAECCCETKMLIQATKSELAAQAVQNFNAITLQASGNQATTMQALCGLSREVEGGFAATERRDLARDLAAQQDALVAARGEISNLKQTAAILDKLQCCDPCNPRPQQGHHG